jgi:hypothetical protein
MGGWRFKKITGGSARKMQPERANPSTCGEVGVPSKNFGGGGSCVGVRHVRVCVCWRLSGKCQFDKPRIIRHNVGINRVI